MYDPLGLIRLSYPKHGLGIQLLSGRTGPNMHEILSPTPTPASPYMLGASKVKAITAKPKDLSLIYRTHGREPIPTSCPLT